MNKFVLCINNYSNPASLILGKVYCTLPDSKADSYNMLRVIDEDTSEPDGYLYPKSMFVEVSIPEKAEIIVQNIILQYHPINHWIQRG